MSCPNDRICSFCPTAGIGDDVCLRREREYFELLIRVRRWLADFHCDNQRDIIEAIDEVVPREVL